MFVFFLKKTKTKKLIATNADSIILDGELLLMDSATRKPLPFGTLGIHRKEQVKT